MFVIGTVLATLTVAAIPEREKNGLPHLRSESVLVRFADTKEVILSKAPDQKRPIASVTKLLSGLLLSKIGAESGTATVSDAAITITEEDKDRLKWSRSRLKVGLSLTRSALLDAALGASDNRAMYAVVRSFGIPRSRFVDQMNRLAVELGMRSSKFADPAGIHPDNVSTASDLLKLLDAVSAAQDVRARTLSSTIELLDASGRKLLLSNPNRLTRSGRWDLIVGKTGYTAEAGRALVLRMNLAGRPVDMVFLGAREMASVFGDAGRVKRWLAEKLSAS